MTTPTSGNAETLGNLLGKIHRINSDGSIPTDNPFYNTATGQNRAIWAYGIRNPFTFSFQPASGRMFINDVGQGTWEEINDGIAGSNYGWPTTEGTSSDPRFRNPLFNYGHGSTATTGCAITGGVFYNPPAGQFPAQYVGDYFFADYCTGWIRKLDPANGNTVIDFASGAQAPVDIDVGSDGSLYYLSRFGVGHVYRITYTGSLAPTMTTHPASQTVSVGDPATFTATASGNPPLNFQWQRNGVNISGATSESYTLDPAQMSDNGARFRVLVSNGTGNDDEQRGDAHGHGEPAADRDDHRSRGGDDVPGRRPDLVRGDGHRPRAGDTRRRAASRGASTFTTPITPTRSCPRRAGPRRGRSPPRASATRSRMSGTGST